MTSAAVLPEQPLTARYISHRPLSRNLAAGTLAEMAANGTGELGAALRALRTDREYSLGRLSRALYDAGSGIYEASFISQMETGKKAVPVAFLLGVGALLEPTIRELPQYHLAQARRLLDEREVGLEEALANYERRFIPPEADVGLPGVPRPSGQLAPDPAKPGQARASRRRRATREAG